MWAQERIRELRVLLKPGVVGACLPRRKVERGGIQAFSELQCEFRVSLGKQRRTISRQRQGDLCLFKISLIYTASSRSAKTLSQKNGFLTCIGLSAGAKTGLARSKQGCGFLPVAGSSFSPGQWTEAGKEL